MKIINYGKKLFIILINICFLLFFSQKAIGNGEYKAEYKKEKEKKEIQ